MTTETPNAQVPTKRTFRGSTLVFVALLSAALATLAALYVPWFLGSGADSAKSAATDGALYRCPMHPAVVQDHPGDCPICGMKLVKVQKEKGATAASQPSQRTVLFYRSPMDPKQTSPMPRKDEMGMDYLPVYADEVSSSAPVAGLANVEIDAAQQQLIGLKTAEVSEAMLGGALRTVGRVAIDETRVRRVNVKVPGFVARIYVDYVGKKVKKGDPLFSLYSPELLSTQEEYLLARKTEDELRKVGAQPSAEKMV